MGTRRRFVAAWFAAACLGLAACADPDNSTPTTPPVPPGSGAIQVNGTERLGWEQAAPSVDALRTYGYFAYVDDVPGELAGATCASTAGANGFACSARLPPMTPGTHTIHLTAYVDQGGRFESAKSGPLQVRLVTIVTSAAATDGESLLRQITTVDGVPLQVPSCRLGAPGPDGSGGGAGWTGVCRRASRACARVSRRSVAGSPGPRAAGC